MSHAHIRNAIDESFVHSRAVRQDAASIATQNRWLWRITVAGVIVFSVVISLALLSRLW